MPLSEIIVIAFGLFQFLMPVFGWYIGFKIEPFVKSVEIYCVCPSLLYWR